MRRWQLHRHILLVIFLFSLGAILVSWASNPTSSIEEPLARLLEGKSTDLQGVLSTIPDTDLPKALGVAEALRFKTVHGDSCLPLDEIERFREAARQKIERSLFVRLQASEDCPNLVASKKVSLGGETISIPAHFTADPTSLLEFGPTGEAGSLFPSVWGIFGKRPKSLELFIDGKPVLVSWGRDATFRLTPPCSPEHLFSIGTHTAALTYDTSSGKKGKTWTFTVGVLAHPDGNVDLGDATEVSSFTINSSAILPGTNARVVVRVFSKPDGKQVLVYETGSGRTKWQTQSVRNLEFLIQKKPRNDVDAEVYPQTPCLFASNTLHLSYTYAGPGTIISEKWLSQGVPIADGSTYETVFSGYTEHWSIWLNLTLEGPDGPISGSAVGGREYSRINFSLEPHQPRLWKYFSREKVNQIPMSVRQNIRFAAEGTAYSFTSFKEGDKIPIEKGFLIVSKLHWKQVAGDVEPEIQQVSATETVFLFKKPGLAEFVREAELAFLWNDEVYQKSFEPVSSCLYGAFDTKGSIEYRVFPPGAIQGTTRRVVVAKYTAEIRGRKKTFLSKDELVFDTPWILATSTLFPDSAPIEASRIMPYLFVKLPDVGVGVINGKDPFVGELTLQEQSKPTELEPVKVRPYFSIWSNKIPADRFDPDDYDFLFGVGEWQNIRVFPSPADLIKIEVAPDEPPSIQEGETLRFSCKVLPEDGLGTGEISEFVNSLNLLDGYVAETLPAFAWKADLASRTKFTENGWAFDFKPGKGTGTYEITVDTQFPVVESVTKTVGQVQAKVSANVLVKEGLRIFSPTKGFAYPAGMPIPLKTTLDKNPESWKKISWTLNHKPWKPAEDEPPAFLTIEEPNDHVILEAKLTSTDSNGQEIELSDKVEFAVKPVSAVISPLRKVVPKHAGPVDLNLSVTLGKSVVENTSTVVGWSDFLKAKVEKVEWSGTFGQGGAGNVSPNSDQCNAAATFEKPGALTTLATVTVKIWSTDPKKPYDETFAFQATRSDVWAIEEPGNLTLNPDDFPKKGIAKAYRTFAPKEITFTLGETGYTWHPPGTEPLLKLPPAIPFLSGGSGPAGVLLLTWKGPGSSTASGSVFQPLLPDVGEYVVDLDLSLSFGAAGRFPLGSHNVVGEAEDFYSLVKASIDPASFPIWVGQQQKLTFVIEPIGQTSPPTEPPSEPPPVLAKGFILIQDGNFQAEVNSVVWVKDGSTLGTGNPYDYSAKVKAVETITGKAKVEVKEAKTSPVAKPTVFDHSADTKTVIGRLIAYPRKGYQFPASSSIPLAAYQDLPNKENIIWYFDDEEIKKGATAAVPPTKVSPGDHVIKAVLPDVQSSEECKIHVFPWSLVLTPSREVVLMESASTTVPVSLNATVAGIPIASGSSLKIDNARVTVESLILEHRGDPKENVDYSGLSGPGSGTCRFIKPAAFGLRASFLLSIIQTDASTAMFAPDPAMTLFGTVDAKAEYSFSFEPIRAIVGMTREFSIGSITITLDKTKVLIDKNVPVNFSPPVVLVKSMFANQAPIHAIGFDHSPGIQQLPNGKKAVWSEEDKLKLDIFFPAKKPVKAYWVPKLRTNAKRDLTLHEASKVVSPKTLDEIIATRVEIDPSTVGTNELTTAKYLFGLTPESITNQSSMLYPSDKDPDIKVSLEKVAWKLLSSATTDGFPLSETTPTIKVSRPLPGNYILSAVGDFSAIPHETNIPAKEGVEAPKEAFTVKGEFLAWEVIPDKPDHLERIASVTSANSWVELYAKNGHWVWRQKDGKIETQPLAVGISSELTLKPIIDHRLEELVFKWFDASGEMIQFGHAHLFESGATIKTPDKIGFYSLTLAVPGLQEYKIPNVFALFKIMPNSNFQRIYFLNCISDSVAALSGSSVSSNEKSLIDRFYQWWWNVEEKLKYAASNASSTSHVIKENGGMCQGLGNLFYKSLELQGIPAENSPSRPRLRRFGYLLYPVTDPTSKVGSIFEVSDNFQLPVRPDDPPYSPSSPEYWGGMIVTDPGLNQTAPTSTLPNPTSLNSYASEPLTLQTHSKKKIPPTDMSNPADYVDLLPGNISTSTLKCYSFVTAGKGVLDGHAFVIWEDDVPMLYDPSFGKNRFKAFPLDQNFPFPSSYKGIEVISYGGKVQFPRFWDYLSQSVDYWRSNTPCVAYKKEDARNWRTRVDLNLEMPVRPIMMLIIDATFKEVNFLRLVVGPYRSNED